jgi:GTPase
MLIDEVRISIKAGNGGNGNVHFYSDKSRPRGGPDGGDGGKGGDVYFLAVNDISKLNQFRNAKKFEAQNGFNGGRNQCTGHDGEDLVLEVPVGTLVSYDNGTQVELLKTGDKVLIAKGGSGGHGNWYYRSSTNQSPQEAQKGYKTDYKNLYLQLKLIAQVGLIGLPNAGKSTLLNELTNANAKIANYQFTTLEPNLGVMKNGKIIADIPGLIEGASYGKGLGIKFLKHVERTNLLVHCLAADSQDLKKDYQIIRNELSSYSSTLASKPEIIVITKTDLVEKIPKFKHDLKVSILDDDSIKSLNDIISSKLS